MDLNQLNSLKKYCMNVMHIICSTVLNDASKIVPSLNNMLKKQVYDINYVQ